MPVLFSLFLLLAALPLSALAATPEEEGAKAKALLLRHGHTEDLAGKIAGMVRDSLANEAAGLRTVAPLVSVDVVAAPKSRKDLAQFLDGGDLLPEDRAPLPPVTRENFAAVVERLHAPDDLDLWMRDKAGQPLDAAGLSNAAQQLARQKRVMLERLPKFDKDYGAAATDQWLALFNRAAAGVRFPAREVYRRLLLDARFVVQFPLLPEKLRDGFSEPTGNAAGELLLLSSFAVEETPRVLLAQTDKSEQKVLLPAPARLPQSLEPARASISLGVASLLDTYGNQKRTEAAREQRAKDEKYSAKLDKDIAAAREQRAKDEKDIAAAREQRAKDEKDIAAAREQRAKDEKDIAAARKDIAADRRIIELGKKLRNLTEETEQLVLAYRKTPTPELRQKAQRKTEELERHCAEIDRFVEVEKGDLKEGQALCTSVKGKIVDPFRSAAQGR